MAQRRRKSKDSGLERVTVMVPADLKAAIDAQVETGVRTFSDVAREALRRGLDQESPKSALIRSIRAKRGPPTWPRAMGHLVTLYCQELQDIGADRGETEEMFHAGFIELFSGVRSEAGKDASITDEDREYANTLAKFLVLKLKRADAGEMKELSDVLLGLSKE